MVLQAGIQTKVWEGGLSGETQLRSNEALMLVGGPSPENFWKCELRNLFPWPLWDPAESLSTQITGLKLWIFYGLPGRDPD